MQIKRTLYWPITVMGKPRMTRSDKWKKRDRVVNYRTIADALRTFADKDKFTLGNHLHAVFFLPMSESWSEKKKAEMHGTLHNEMPDTDNLLKSICDSLAKQDKEIAVKLGVKLWSYEGGLLLYEYEQDQIVLSRLDLRLTSIQQNQLHSGPEDANNVPEQRDVKSILLSSQKNYQIFRSLLKGQKKNNKNT
jgi:Holliday junction resolvase RusA-like endonuclease